MPRIARQLSQFSRAEVDTFFKQAKRIAREPAFTILAAPQKEDFGKILVITPRHIGKAAQRNKIRRRLKSIFYEEKLFERGYDVAFIVKKDALTLSFDQLKQLTLDLLSKLS